MSLGVIKSLFLQILPLYSDKIAAYLVVSFLRKRYSVSYTCSWRIKKVFDNGENSPPFVKMARSIFFYGRQKEPAAYSWSAALF